MDAIWIWLGWLAGMGLVIAGMLGTLLPVIPGPPLVLFGLWLIALLDNYQRVGGATLIVIGLIAVLSVAIDFIAAALGAKRVGASPQAVSGALLGSVIGVFFAAPGLILGPFFGALAGEWVAQRRLGRAAHVGFATWLGLILGSLAKLGLSLTMVAIFIVAYVL